MLQWIKNFLNNCSQKWQSGTESVIEVKAEIPQSMKAVKENTQPTSSLTGSNQKTAPTKRTRKTATGRSTKRNIKAFPNT